MKTVVITGGAGFIGVNTAAYFADSGWQVAVVDNLSRRGADLNLHWLRSNRPVTFHRADIRDEAAMARLVRELRPDALVHLAAQVAVTTSVADPRADFTTNALGTLNVLEAVRKHAPECFFINASTNKVYGKLDDIPVLERNGRYEYRDLKSGVNEKQNLDFHSPYGCSKGVADQYTIDYARIYGLNTVTLRQSCIYGPRQFGIEDQGWVAWFVIAALMNKPITIYGDGKQIRDALHVDDLVRCYQATITRRDAVSGQAFNIGGGPGNTLSLLELLGQLERRTGASLSPAWDGWRPGDQPVFVCDIAKARSVFDWQPQVTVEEGVGRLIDWVGANRDLFENAEQAPVPRVNQA